MARAALAVQGRQFDAPNELQQHLRPSAARPAQLLHLVCEPTSDMRALADVLAAARPRLVVLDLPPRSEVSALELLNVLGPALLAAGVAAVAACSTEPEGRADLMGEFYAAITPPGVTPDAAAVMRQALAGMLWSKQSYYFDVDVWLLPNLGAVNLVVHGLLGQGVAASTRFDPQAKGLGEWLRSRLVSIEESLL